LTILSFLLYRRVLKFPSFLKHRYCQALPSRHTTALSSSVKILNFFFKPHPFRYA